MATVPQTPVSVKAFYCTFHGLSGVITRPAANVLFLDPDSGAVITLTQADTADLVVLGEVATSMQQYCGDMARGGAAKIACTRRQEVA